MMRDKAVMSPPQARRRNCAYSAPATPIPPYPHYSTFSAHIPCRAILLPKHSITSKIALPVQKYATVFESVLLSPTTFPFSYYSLISSRRIGVSSVR